ncbi:hypothetical protein BC936DRAFT_149643 [Jimgerdemannia flammicorona]|uniref:Uncharacterized protein n=1 Tax=Jimgerdemannia flammicorona TaxID=994334 RepID=A0A433D0F8_9FUNG|nr:hypothetical protein BC936DRAFT_149643 [Jimgerdemannia flammicorona]
MALWRRPSHLPRKKAPTVIPTTAAMAMATMGMETMTPVGIETAESTPGLSVGTQVAVRDVTDAGVILLLVLDDLIGEGAHGAVQTGDGGGGELHRDGDDIGAEVGRHQDKGEVC